jgi:phage tail sheath protein FI
LTADHPVDVVGHIIDNIAEVRKDVVVFVSPPKAAVVDNVNQEVTDILQYRDVTLNKNTTYAFMDSGWKYQIDKYNDVFRWIPLNGDVAGLASLVDPWVSFAGLNRGFIKNVIKLAYNPDKADRDELYKAGVNSVVSFQGQGTVLWGDKTLSSRPSAFDRINVRRLFIAIEKAIVESAKYTLFEINDDFTRARFVGLVEPYLREIKGKRGLTNFRVVCDETNNTPFVINSNSFVADIYIVPPYSINTIQLNFVGVPNGVELNVIVGQF